MYACNRMMRGLKIRWSKCICQEIDFLSYRGNSCLLISDLLEINHIG